MGTSLRQTILVCVLAVGGITVVDASPARAQYVVNAFREGDPPDGGEYITEYTTEAAARARAAKLLAVTSELTGKYIFEASKSRRPTGRSLCAARRRGRRKSTQRKSLTTRSRNATRPAICRLGGRRLPAQGWGRKNGGFGGWKARQGQDW